MKGMCFVAAMVYLLSAGCSTSNVNPPTPRAHTGYVDFYTDSSQGLSWEVKRGSEAGGEMRTVFSEFKPVEGTILRLAAPPGTYRFQVWFSNQVTEGPQTVSVLVQEGKVTPVHVTLTPVGKTSVDRKSYGYRPTARATRQVPRIVSEQNVVFQIGAEPGAPQEYHPKEQMPYFSSSTGAGAENGK